MKKIVCDSYEEVSRAAADLFSHQLEKKPDSVFGLSTGSTPIGLYEELAYRNKAGRLDFSRARSFNLDEYYPISKSHPQSYCHFMHEHFFDKVNLSSSSLPNGEAGDPLAECARYDAEIEAAGGIDLQLLGIGLNGHIGFNEPTVSYSLGTCLVELDESTLVANSRFFGPDERQPTRALSMGIGSIFSARSIVLLITGANKAGIAKKLFEGLIHTDVPACLLLLHPDVTIILDRKANGW